METLLAPTETTHDEKLQEALERIREESALIDDSFESPAWHEQALRETEAQVAAGITKFIPWEEAVEIMDRKIAEYHERAHQ